MASSLEPVNPCAPRYCIAYAGLPPEWQRNGVGSALVARMLERCDTERCSAYLEVASERTATLNYRRGFEVVGRGFEVVGEVRPKKGLSLWLMWRNERVVSVGQ